ncbi:MAG: bifunctional phosphoribosylaminoimidazolecarboxamide formyltransferase/IMP cyclohydrolase [Saprospiraceae bacterium]|jgi:phosphoribosylaminoimidazolecarboxamide formyltransferase/IMP cyclohydrolase|nr:bifunctional phosphoribosylaminoimidazolecarboxamide formyltransferase/IMP cyclohydrolase [Saprospiraceae bacterium]MBP9210255.1 bifunctional phosphoribosylaminoimidazolecarboxamide formyltransferase/IMP cyclohydrolase [Saprospiraceae bacterium]MBV6473771.1 Bifunctional purine biosynthesis protein PurH [Saprospiraceae bacterium]
MENKRIHAALLSVYNKQGLEDIARQLHAMGIVIYSTGGTQQHLEDKDIPVVAVEDITDYPSILGGRVKTLHPKIFGGILAMRNEDHLGQLAHFQIPLIDLVVVDLYPFQETLAQTREHDELIEKIDIGGISLIRAAAKNFQDVVVIPSFREYGLLKGILANNAISSLEQRRQLAARAFSVSQAYDHSIHTYLAGLMPEGSLPLRYGENPHQTARYLGDLDECLDVLCGKELSYNNLLDIDSALSLMSDFHKGPPCFAVLKHTNVCGIAVRENLTEAWGAALAGDPVSAYGGILICNAPVDEATAKAIHPLFFEVLLAPGFEEEALNLLKTRKQRILIRIRHLPVSRTHVRSAINGLLEQDPNEHHTRREDLKPVTRQLADKELIDDLIFAIHCVKHLKSNAIALVKGQQLIGMGCGQTSRVDACRQAIEKAAAMGFDPAGSAMASEAFFPFPDCVELAAKAGVAAIAQPGGSVNDALSIQAADDRGIAMAFTGIRHFKH